MAKIWVVSEVKDIHGITSGSFKYDAHSVIVGIYGSKEEAVSKLVPGCMNLKEYELGQTYISYPEHRVH